MNLADQVYDRIWQTAPWADENDLMVFGEHLIMGDVVITVDGIEAAWFVDGNLKEWQKNKN
jgi:hypothetical protein